MVIAGLGASITQVVCGIEGAQNRVGGKGVAEREGLPAEGRTVYIYTVAMRAGSGHPSIRARLTREVVTFTLA